MKKILTVGNPNSGKTTLFNRLTGANQAVGNWPGVTIDKKSGFVEFKSASIQITDLPGIYSLDQAQSVQSLDESIAVHALSNLETDLILNIVDASALERSLYLTLQLRELGKPMVVVLNKMDLIERQGIQLNAEKLQELLGCPVLVVSSTSTQSYESFLTALEVQISTPPVNCGKSLDFSENIETLIKTIRINPKDGKVCFTRVEALRIIAGDLSLLEKLEEKSRVELTAYLQPKHDDYGYDLHLANTIYTEVANIVQASRVQTRPLKERMTDKIDTIVLNQYLALPIFFTVMYLMFMFSINIGSSFIDFFDITTGTILVDGVHHLFDGILPIWALTILADGIGGGIQTVATFIPVIACLYLFMSLLESSGYMARAAFVLDKGMQAIGLPGKAFVPLVLGFGCNVPAIMATRTLDQERERRLSAAMAPFMSCGARLPVYALFAAAFFPNGGQNLVFLLYLIGIFVAILTGYVLRKTLYPGKSEPLMMEIPNYELPRLKDVGIKTWQKLKRFVLGAGKTIIIVITLLSFFNSFGTDGSFGNQDSEQSVLSAIAKEVTPVFSPIGIEADNWQATVGIITGIFAKEAVVGTLNSLYATSVDEESSFDLLASLTDAIQSIPENLFDISFTDPLGVSLGDQIDQASVAETHGVDVQIFTSLNQHFNTSSALAFLVFVLLYTPCVAAMGAYVREFGHGFAWFIGIWTMGVGYVAATMTYQIATFMESPIQSGISLLVCVAVIGLTFQGMKYIGQRQQLKYEHIQ